MLEAQSGRVRCLFLYLPEEWINHYLSNSRYLKWKGSRCYTLSKTASVSDLWGHESWDSVGSNMQLLNILIQLLCTCKVSVDRQCLFSQRWPYILAFNAHSPVPIRVHRCVFRRARVILPLGQSFASAMVRQCLYRLKPGSHQVETSLLSCSQPTFLSAFFHEGQWRWWHNPHVTAASPLCLTVMRPGSRAKGAVANNVQPSASGQARLSNQVPQVLTLQSNHSILIHLTSKHWLWDWHLLLSNQRKCYSKHKKAMFISRGLRLQYMVTQLAWMR